MKLTKATLLRTAAIALVTGAASCSKDDDAAAPDHFRPATANSSRYISQVLEYRPAPGQFTNTPGLGDMAGAQKLVGGMESLVSLGAYGGSVVFGFDHSIENKTGADIGIYGNPLVNEGMEWSEPGIVMVMQDLNGNGKPDDGEWYELAGSEYNSSATIRNYRITYYNPKSQEAADVLWKDNQGRSGYVLANSFHNQPYYPAGAGDSLSFSGTLLKNTFKKEFHPVYQTYLFTNLPFSWGYSDNGSQELKDRAEEEGRGCNTFDIAWAVNAKGEKVNLKYIDFVKVYTAQNCNGSLSQDPARADRMLGEVSTEISGAVDMHLKK